MHNSDFSRGEVLVAESVFDIALLEGTFLFDSHANKEAEGFGAENGRILLRFGPYSFFMIYENNDARLSPEGKEVLILFDGEDTHGGNGSWVAIFSYCTIFAKGDALEGAHVFNEILLFIIDLHPYFMVRVGLCENLKKGGWSIFG